MEDEMLSWQRDAGTVTLCPLRGRLLQVEIEGRSLSTFNKAVSR